MYKSGISCNGILYKRTLHNVILGKSGIFYKRISHNVIFSKSGIFYNGLLYKGIPQIRNLRFELCRLPQRPSLTLHPLGGSTPLHVAIVPTESKGKTEGNDWDTACGNFKT
jgi:hypothetical protein